MPTAAERQALAFLAGVALLGGGVRAWQHRSQNADIAEHHGSGVSSESVGDQLAAIDSARTSKRGKRPKSGNSVGRKSTTRDSTKLSVSHASSSRPSAKKSQRAADDAADMVVDVDFANVEELQRLPHIGRALAERIIANRDLLGYFGSIQALGRVRGLGMNMRRDIEKHAVFSGTPRRPPSGAVVEEPRKSIEAKRPKAGRKSRGE